jgi:FtsZ-binding cell division protein ZapB
MSPIANSLPPTTQSDIIGILQREQDHAIALLSLSPLLSSLFVSYANRTAALESTSTTPSPESQEWKGFQATITALQEEVEKLKSENVEMAGGLGAAAASQEAFRSQISCLKEANTSQQGNIMSLQAELIEANDQHDRAIVGSNAEMAALHMRVLDLEVGWDHAQS